MMHDPLPAVAPGAMNVIAALLEARTGQVIANNRAWRLETALRPLLRERELDTLDQLVSQLLDGSDPTIGTRVVDALLNQESSFFRDAGVFELAVDAIRARPDAATRRARVWSAGCSHGQEPLSLAMMFAELASADMLMMPEIVATDVSEGAVVRARAGRFTQFEIQRGLPVRRMVRWFDTVGEQWQAKPELLKHIAFRRHNLVADPLPGGLFDLVCCRNVLFYLGAEARAQVFERLAGALRPGGVLLLGAGETVIGLTDAFRPSRRFRGLYERAPDAAVPLARVG